MNDIQPLTARAEEALSQQAFAPLTRLAAKNSSGSFASLLDKAKQIPGKPVIDKKSKLYQQCEALETFLVKNVLSSMRKTVQKSGFLKQDFAGNMYEDMLYDKYAENLTKNADFGLAELAYLELTGQRGKVINESV